MFKNCWNRDYCLRIYLHFCWLCFYIFYTCLILGLEVVVVDDLLEDVVALPLPDTTMGEAQEVRNFSNEVMLQFALSVLLTTTLCEECDYLSSCTRYTVKTSLWTCEHSLYQWPSILCSWNVSNLVTYPDIPYKRTINAAIICTTLRTEWLTDERADRLSES